MRPILLVILMTAMAGAQDRTLDLPLEPAKWQRFEAERPAILPEPTPIRDVPSPPPVFFGETIPVTSSLVYVLDFSQSMGVFATRIDYRTIRSRWEVVALEFKRSLSGLAESFEFGLVVFGTNRGCSVRVWRSELSGASEDNKAAALGWLGQFSEALLYGGATPAAPGVLAALDLKPQRVLLLTDGKPSPCGLLGYPWRTHRRAILKGNTDGIPIDVFGIGLPDQYSKEFCLGVASDSGGSFFEPRIR